MGVVIEICEAKPIKCLKAVKTLVQLQTLK